MSTKLHMVVERFKLVGSEKSGHSQTTADPGSP